MCREEILTHTTKLDEQEVQGINMSHNVKTWEFSLTYLVEFYHIQTFAFTESYSEIIK
jgi:hypothetical protein